MTNILRRFRARFRNAELHVLEALRACAEGGEAVLTEAALADLAEVSRSVAYDALNRAEALGLVAIEQRPHQPTRFRIVRPWWPATPEEAAEDERAWQRKCDDALAASARVLTEREARGRGRSALR